MIENVYFAYNYQIDSLIIKQLNKSIFYNDKLKLLDNFKNMYNKNIPVTIDKKGLNWGEFISPNDLYFFNNIHSNETGIWPIEMIRMNLYLLFRLFTRAGIWDNKRHSVPINCINETYPTKSIVFAGDDHISWIKYFLYYLNIHPIINVDIQKSDSVAYCIELKEIPFI